MGDRNLIYKNINIIINCKIKFSKFKSAPPGRGGAPRKKKKRKQKNKNPLYFIHKTVVLLFK